MQVLLGGDEPGNEAQFCPAESLRVAIFLGISIPGGTDWWFLFLDFPVANDC